MPPAAAGGVDLTPGRRYSSAMQSSEPRARIVVNDGARAFFAEPGLPLLFALMGQRIFIPSACGGRASCGQCRVRVLSGADGHAREELPLISENDRGRGIHLSCQLRVHGEVRIEIPETHMRARQYWTRVASFQDLTHDMREVVLQLLDPDEMSFTAGQYIQFLLPGTERAAQPVYRAYSITSAPSSPGRLTLVFGKVPGGACSSYVFQRLRVGDAVTVNGPLGDFHLHDSDNDILLVAGGSGMAPVRSILLDMAQNRSARTATFFFAARAMSDLFYHVELRALAKDLPGFRFVPVLSHPGPDDAWDGQKGGIAAALGRLLPPLLHHEAYLCGSPGMIDACINALTARGLREERIFYDKFS
jgi:Na+-transporting NADH:ubiquinone oxidoreductase subunit F